MPKQKQDFQCEVVNETVRISLRKKATAGLMSKHVFFVQCDQGECQYVDANEPPCPLTPALFRDEILNREEAAKQRRGDPWDDD